MGTPVLSAVGRVNRENVVYRGADQRTVDHERGRIEVLIQMGVVAALYFQSANGLRIDLAKRRVSLRGEGPVVARPGSGVGRLGMRWRRRIGRASGTDGGHRWSGTKVHGPPAPPPVRASYAVQY